MTVYQSRFAYEHPLRRPAHICVFSGCRRFVSRRVGRWDLCKLHADNLEKEKP